MSSPTGTPDESIGSVDDPIGQPDDDVAVGEIVDDPDTADLDTADPEATDAAARLRGDIDLTLQEAEDRGQTAEEAVAEAVEVAQRLQVERDELRDLVQRVQADFENFKRRVETQRTEQRAQAALDLVRELLPVLDVCDAAVDLGNEDVAQVRAHLLGILEKLGLARVGGSGTEFDPNVHEAVMHEEGDGEAVVVDVLRAGYLWNQRVVRPAMVKVKG